MRAAKDPRRTEDRSLAVILEQVAEGLYPEADGLTEVVPCPSGAEGAVLAFTGHNIVAADIDPKWVLSRCAPWDLSEPMRPGFLLALGDRINARPGHLDLVFCAKGKLGNPDIDLLPISLEACKDHPRVRHALRTRGEVQVYRTPDSAGLLTIGRGLAGRWEAGFEVDVAHRDRGLGRAIARVALHLIPPDEALFLQVAPGNVASLKAILSSGFAPAGAEVLFTER